MTIVYTILGTFNSGGMERVLANKANYFAQLGYTVIIITTDQQGRSPYFEMNPAIEHIDLNINYTDILQNGIIKRAFSYFKKQRIHYKLLKERLFVIKADVLISMFDNDASFVYKIKDGSKKILEIHFSRFKRMQYGRKGLLQLIDLYRSKNDVNIARKYDRFIVLTKEDQTYWGDINNIEVIPNANSFVATNKATLEHKNVIAVGRFDFQKGFDDLIQAWHLLHKEHLDWKLNIYGDGPLRGDLEKLILELDLENVVFLQKPTKYIIDAYLDHSILAMSSRYEGLPMVLLEAQVCGLPLVAYACKCGPRDIINGNGFLVDEGNISALATAISSLMDDDALRKKMGTISIENSKNYSEAQIMNKWLTLFDNLKD